MKSGEITFDKVPYRSSALHQRAVLVEALISSNSLAFYFFLYRFQTMKQKSTFWYETKCVEYRCGSCHPKSMLFVLTVFCNVQSIIILMIIMIGIQIYMIFSQGNLEIFPRTLNQRNKYYLRLLF